MEAGACGPSVVSCQLSVVNSIGQRARGIRREASPKDDAVIRRPGEWDGHLRCVGGEICVNLCPIERKEKSAYICVHLRPIEREEKSV